MIGQLLKKTKKTAPSPKTEVSLIPELIRYLRMADGPCTRRGAGVKAEVKVLGFCFLRGKVLGVRRKGGGEGGAGAASEIL
jgi:hypothetical protein